jgi:F-type H+-transporting ATPase subunit epsilon
MAALHIQIIMPDKKKLDDFVDLAVLPGIDGDFEVQKDHTFFITMLRTGVLRIQKQDVSEYYAVHDGFVTVENNKILILSEVCENKTEIDLDRANTAKDRAELRMKEKPIESCEIDFRRAEIALKKALTRISTAKL